MGRKVYGEFKPVNSAGFFNLVSADISLNRATKNGGGEMRNTTVEQRGTLLYYFCYFFIFLTFITTFSLRARALDILIGSGQTTNFNYHVGKVLCRMINTNIDSIDCQHQRTTGSISNLDNVRLGSLDLGIVASDIQYHAINKTGMFKFMDLTYANLRSLFSLHDIPFTLIVHKNSKIKTLEDLSGKRVNLGNFGSSQRNIMNDVMKAQGWTKKEFLLTEEFTDSQSQLSLALCHGGVQATVSSNVHPDLVVKQLTNLCDAIVIGVRGKKIESLLSSKPYYIKTTLPGGLYDNNDDGFETIGLKSTVITSEDLDQETAYRMVKIVFNNLYRLKRMHPTFNNLTPLKMATEGLTAPLHPGAMKFYKEKGWM